MNAKNNRLRSQAAAAALATAFAHAQIATDGSVGARVTLTGPNYGIAQSLGFRSGTNLLHSFELFNIRRGESATFSGQGGIERIIARVTGGSASGIDGLLRSTIPGASLYLVNPAGVVFGENASLDVAGSFYASTASYLRLADGTRIPATATSDVLLTAAPIEAFGFSGAANGIFLSGAQLRVRDGQRLGLVGGAVHLGSSGSRASTLTAQGGAIAIVGTASAGEARVDGDAIRPEGFTRLGDVSIRGNALVSVNESSARTGAGTIYIRGEDLTVDQSVLRANTRFGNARGIDLGATGTLEIAASQVLATTVGAGNAGSLRLEGQDIVISGSSLVDTSCDPGCTTGTAGRIDVRAPGSLRLIGTDPLVPTFLVANSFGGGRTGEIDIQAGALVLSGNAAIQSIPNASGDGATIRLRTGSILLANGAQVDVSVRGNGNGGRIEVENSGAIIIDGTQPNSNPNPAPGDPTFFPSGFISGTLGNGAGGDIVISTRTLEIVRGGQIASSAGSPTRSAAGTAGAISVTASERITIDGFATSAGLDPSGIFAGTFGSGAGGAIALSAPTIRVVNSGRVDSQSSGTGNSGAITIQGRDLSIASRGQIATTARRGGAGGDISIDLGGTLEIVGGASGIFASTLESGPGGRVGVLATNVRMGDGGVIAAQTNSTRADAGDGGAIRVEARESVTLDSGASITAETFSTGAGGTVEIRAGGTLTLDGGARITTRSTQPGDAGNITVYARDAIVASGDSRISSQSDAGGLAGTITVLTDGVLQLSSGARITTQAVSSDGGDILVTALSALLDQAQITTEVGTGQGGGGNMDLRIETLVMRSSTITANAFGGPGGNIFIATKTFIPSADSKVTASSQLGIDGTITIESPALDPTGELLVPGIEYFDAASVLAGRCGPRLAGRASSLLIEPRRLADVSPDALRSMLELLAPAADVPCCPAPVSRS